MPGSVGARGRLADALVVAVVSGGSRLAAVRGRFAKADPRESMRRLVIDAVDPELLSAVVGPALAPRWVPLLEAQYRRFELAYPADWPDVEQAWKVQRRKWRRRAAVAGGPRPLSRPYPERDPAASRAPAGRAAPPRGRSAGPRPRPPAPGRPAAPAPSPAPFGRAPAAGPGEESVAAPAEVDTGGGAAALAEEIAREDGPRPAREEAPRAGQAAERDRSLRSAGGAGRPSPDRPPAPPDSSPDPPSPAAPSSDPPPPAARAAPGGPRVPAAAGGELPPLLVERLLDAILTSREAVDAVRSAFLEAGGGAGGWHAWRLPPHVCERLRERARERAVSALR